MRTTRMNVEIRYVVIDETSAPHREMAKSTKEVERAAKDLDRQVVSSESKFKRWGKAVKEHSAKLGAAGRAAIRMASDISASGRDTEQALFAIQAAYKGTASDWVAWAGRMQEATIYSDEAFMQSAQNMKTLIDNYGLTEDQVRELIGASADLAAVNRIDVYDATTRLQSAIRGEAEASEFLGLTLNDTYMKNKAFGGSLKDTWEKLSDNEKAQYRYKESLNQAAYAQGKAEEATSTAEGQYKRLQNQLQDVTSELGRAINQSGPWIQVLEDGMGLIDAVLPLYTALKLARVADTGATVTHTAAQMADNAAMVAGTTATQGLTTAIGGAGVGLVGALAAVVAIIAEVGAALVIFGGLALEQDRINKLSAQSTQGWQQRLSELKLELQHGVITEEMFLAGVQKINEEMTRSGTAAQLAKTGVHNLNAELGAGRVVASELATEVERTTTALKGLQIETEFTGDAAVRGINAQKQAYEELQLLPAQRAKTEETWQAIILEAAKQSDDERIKSAAAAVTANENLWGSYWETFRTSSDTNLALQVARYDAEMRKLDELETELKATMSGAETATKNFATGWEKQSNIAWQAANADFAEWDRQLTAILAKPRTFTITGQYVPPSGPPQYQYGGQQPGSPAQHYPAWLAGGEIVVNPQPGYAARGLEALARAGLIQVAQHTDRSTHTALGPFLGGVHVHGAAGPESFIEQLRAMAV